MSDITTDRNTGGIPIGKTEALGPSPSRRFLNWTINEDMLRTQLQETGEATFPKQVPLGEIPSALDDLGIEYASCMIEADRHGVKVSVR